MPPLTSMDEYFVHQIPEPFPNVVTHHRTGGEPVLHRALAVRHGRRLILTLAHYPARGVMDSLQLGRIDGQPDARAP